MGRVLKGIGTEFILTTFASGVDVVGVKPGTFAVGDYAIALGSDDLSGARSYQDPGAGDQTLVGSLYAGPFQADINRHPDSAWNKLFIDTVRKHQAQYSDQRPPVVHPAYLYDAISIPDFETAAAAAAARVLTKEMIATSTLPLVGDEFGRQDLVTFATNQGMHTTVELSNNSSSNPYGLDTIFNRTLPTLPVVGFTDTIDPRGQSLTISHDAVQAAGKKSSIFIAPVISKLFSHLADTPWETFAAQESAKIAENFSHKLKMPDKIEDVKSNLETYIAVNEAQIQFFRAWGIQRYLDQFQRNADFYKTILSYTYDPDSRVDLDYFIGQRKSHIELALGLTQPDQDGGKSQHIYEAWLAEWSARKIAAQKNIKYEEVNINLEVGLKSE